MYLQGILTEELADVIDTFSDEMGPLSEFTWVPGKRLHDFMVSGGMWLNEWGYALIGRAVHTPEDQHCSKAAWLKVVIISIGVLYFGSVTIREAFDARIESTEVKMQVKVVDGEGNECTRRNERFVC